jgi:phospholipase C
MSGMNIGDLLNGKNISWGSFEGGFNLQTVNPNGTTGCMRSHTNPVSLLVVNDYNGQYTPFQYYPQTSNLSHTRPADISEIGHAGPANHEYDLDDLIAAAKVGNLPAVSYVKAERYQTGHAGGISDPLDEQVFLVKTINALEKTRQWKSMAIVIAFDDSDGDYDHQMSPIFNGSTSPLDALSGTGICGSGDPSLGDAELRCGYGPRLPLLVVSPYARRNSVEHTPTCLISPDGIARGHCFSNPTLASALTRKHRRARSVLRSYRGTCTNWRDNASKRQVNPSSARTRLLGDTVLPISLRFAFHQ